MRVNMDYEAWNAKAQTGDPDSVLSFWKKALRVRKDHELLVRVPFTSLYHFFYVVSTENPDLWRFRGPIRRG